MQQWLAEKNAGRLPGQGGEAAIARAQYRADTLHIELMDLHVGRPGRRGKAQSRVHPGPARVQLALAGRQLQAQLRQLAVEAVQTRNEPARQQAAWAAEHEGRIRRTLA